MKQALPVVDIQQGLLADEPRPAHIRSVIDSINLRARRARAARGQPTGGRDG